MGAAGAEEASQEGEEMKFDVKYTRLRWKIDGNGFCEEEGRLGPFWERDNAEKAVIALASNQYGSVTDGEVQQPVLLVDAVIENRP